MKVKYQGDEYELIRENELDSYITLTFARRNIAGVSMLNYRYFAHVNEIEIDWMYLPYLTIQDLMNIEKDRSTQAALK